MDALATGSIPAAHARSAWAAGIEPLREAFPLHADKLVRAIAYSYVAPLPTPIFIVGGTPTTREALANALGEIAGEIARPRIDPPTLSGIRRAVTPGKPLVLDTVPPASSHANQSMLDQIEVETYVTFSTRLHKASVLIAASSQNIQPLSAGRALTIELPLRPRSLQPLRATESEPARAGRRILASYLQQNASLHELDKHALNIAQHPELDKLRRLGAAFYLGDTILRTLGLDAHDAPANSWLSSDDQIVWAMRDAIRYLLDNGGELTSNASDSKEWVIGRSDRDYLYIRPAEALPFIRAAHGDPTLSTKAITAALRRLHLITSQTGTVRMRIGGEPTRVWKIPTGREL
jgi:hypothetical protein